MALSDTANPPRARIARRSPLARLFGGGTDGNEHLTAVTAVILLALFAVLGVTILFLGQLLWLHLFLGVLLVGPVALKLASTGYRFIRYYTANPAYVRKGPPNPLMRMLGPFVILTTLGVFFTGLLLLLDGPGAPGVLRELHKLTFIAWLGVVGLHVLGHLTELPGALRLGARRFAGHTTAIRTRSRRLPGNGGRAFAVIAAMGIGLVLALLFLPDIHTWTAGGLYDPKYFHGGGEG
jgi:hypothetical protein